MRQPLRARRRQLLHHVVVCLRPVPALAQLPAVDDVADQIKLIARIGLEEIEQGNRLAAWGSQVQVGHEHRPNTRAIGVLVPIVLVGRRCHHDRQHRRKCMELVSRFRFHRRSWCLW